MMYDNDENKNNSFSSWKPLMHLIIRADHNEELKQSADTGNVAWLNECLQSTDS